MNRRPECPALLMCYPKNTIVRCNYQNRVILWVVQLDNSRFLSQMSDYDEFYCGGAWVLLWLLSDRSRGPHVFGNHYLFPREWLPRTYLFPDLCCVLFTQRCPYSEL